MARGFRDFLEEVFAPIDGVNFRRMFGGIGIFRQGIMFGLVADDVLYLKADDTTKVDYQAEGCGPFIYDGKTKPIVMPYWRLPERLFDEPDEFTDWVMTAFEVAERTQKAKAKNSRPVKRKTDA